MTSTQNFTEIVRPRETPPPGVNARAVAKYNDVGHVKDYTYMSETAQDTASDTIND